MIREDMKERVQRGAMFLDKKKPDWHKEIDLSILDMGDGCRCILGQLHEEGYYGVATLVPELGDVEQRADLGFTRKEYHTMWSDLDELWIDEIESRLVRDEMKQELTKGIIQEEQVVA